MKLIIILFILFIGQTSNCQPYLDLVNIRYQNSPDAGVWRRENTANHFQYFNTSFNFPLIFKKDSSMIVFSPFYDCWNIKIQSLPDLPKTIQSLAMPVSLIKPLSRQWALTTTIIPRWNGYRKKMFDNSFQIGGAILASYKKQRNLTYKFGIYYNSEFSGTFIMPLLGIDWQINEKNNLFGVLPGHLVFEHKVNKRFYWGGSFRAITNTYQAGYVNLSAIPKYVRIEDNQLAIFADFYFHKNIAVNLEAGHSVFRKFRFGIENADPKYYFSEKMNDNILLKASLAYRLRFR